MINAFMWIYRYLGEYLRLQRLLNIGLSILWKALGGDLSYVPILLVRFLPIYLKINLSINTHKEMSAA